MASSWVELRKGADYEALSRRFGIDPMILRVIRNREIVGEQEIDLFLNGTLANLHDPLLMSGMQEATALLSEYVSQKKKIRIIGDYDIDGVCATYILWKMLKEVGADVDTAIPHRIRDGYGLNEMLVAEAHSEGREAIITCDNGIAAFEQIALARELGMDVIITDHHEIPFETDAQGEKHYKVPQANVVINPKLPGDSYPFSGICGAVVAWKLASSFLFKAEECGLISTGKANEIVDELLQEAAIATVGDVMELRDENRIIVKEGLLRLSRTKRPGLRALLMATNLWGKPVKANRIGFVLGPCLNASGRLDHASKALRLLQCVDEQEAQILASELKALNEERKEMTQSGVDAAIAQVEELGLLEQDVLVVYLPESHESLAGIIAGKVRERFCHPTFVLTRGEDCVKGSGRSIPAFHMHDHMSACQDVFVKFGGHAMAAGLSIEEDRIEEFRRRINEATGLSEQDFEERINIDVSAPLSYWSFPLIEQLDVLEPTGNGNTKPVFAMRNAKLLRAYRMGKENNFARFKVQDAAGSTFEAVCFYELEQVHQAVTARYGEAAWDALFAGTIRDPLVVHLIYDPDINDFNGRRMQFKIRDCK